MFTLSQEPPMHASGTRWHLHTDDCSAYLQPQPLLGCPAMNPTAYLDTPIHVSQKPQMALTIFSFKPWCSTLLLVGSPDIGSHFFYHPLTL